MLTNTVQGGTDSGPAYQAVPPVTGIAVVCPDLASHADAGHAPFSAWYALRVRALYAFRIRDELRRLGVDEFLPTFTETTRWSDRTKISERQLFPGYLFARLNGCASHVLSIPGVINVLPSNMKPTAIEDSEVSSLRIAIESQLPITPCPHSAGDKVFFRSGPLAGACGVVVRTRDSIRVIVGIEMLGRAVSVTVDAGDLEKAA